MSDQQGTSQGFIPPGFEVITFDRFSTLNTKASRNGIADDQCSWMDGFMPLGPNNCRTLYDIGPTIYTSTPSIAWMDFGNIAATPYAIVLQNDGSIIAINTQTSNVIQILAPGTITSTSPNNIGLTQWGNEFIIIVAGQTNGFFVWDGSNVFTTGTLGPDVTLDFSGLGYTSQPAITTIGGGGSGASFTAEISNGVIDSITVTNPGTGYVPGEPIVLAFSGGGAAGSTAILTPEVSAGTISTVDITNAGTGYTTPTATILDISGIGATISVTATSGTISSVSVIDAGTGYTNPVILIQDPGNPVAVATVDTMPAGISGTTNETFSARLFIGNGNQVQISAPGSLVDFSAGDGGDEFKSTDSFLRVAWSKFKQSNGFIYLIADSSVNYISGIQTSGSPLVTTFSNQNADPEVGSPWEPTCGVLGENIILANAVGVHQGYGGQFAKTSEALDGVYSTVPNFGGITPSAAKAIIFGRRVWMLLLPIINPLTGRQQNKLLMTDGKAWWTSSQSVELTFIATQEINSVLTAYGTDGTNIYQLFQTPSTAFTKTIQSKLWDKPIGYSEIKTSSRIWGAVNYYNPASAQLNITIDNESGTANSIPISLFTSIPIINMLGQAVTIINNAAQVVLVTSANTGIAVFGPQATGQNGVLLGLTLSTACADVALISISIDAVPYSYRG